MLRRTVFLSLFLVLAACSEEQPVAQPTTTVAATSSSPSTQPSTAAATTTTTSGGTAPPTSSSSSTTTTTTTLPIDELQIELVEIASGFEQPVFAISPANDDRLYVVDQPGRIWVLGDGDPTLFTDITDDVVFGGERGLLGLAFHPDFDVNRRLFVNYTGDRGRTRVVEMAASSDGLTADASSQQLLLEIEQPARNHNGGMIAFGPDGHLYVATGDGGGANDEFGQGQRTDTLLAALLRLDVSTPGAYTVPADNPFLDGGGAPEVYSFGLRNPWRFAFDGEDIYIADVGQRDLEEINVLTVAEANGANFGWSIFEGTECFRGPCDAGGVVEPVVEYSHGEGCSITGGFVYRGQALLELRGHYLYADYCSGWIRSLSPEGETRELLSREGNRQVTSFGQDASGEIYVVVQNGSVFRIERA